MLFFSVYFNMLRIALCLLRVFFLLYFCCLGPWSSECWILYSVLLNYEVYVSVTAGTPHLWNTRTVKQVLLPLRYNLTLLNLSHLNSRRAARRLVASTLSQRSSVLWITKSMCVSSAGWKSIDALHAGLSLSGFWGIIKEPVCCAHSTMMTNAVKWTPFLHKSIVLIFSFLFFLFHTIPLLPSLLLPLCVFIKAGEKKKKKRISSMLVGQCVTVPGPWCIWKYLSGNIQSYPFPPENTSHSPLSCFTEIW